MSAGIAKTVPGVWADALLGQPSLQLHDAYSKDLKLQRWQRTVHAHFFESLKRERA